VTKEENGKKVVNALIGSKEGITLTEITKETKLARQTISVVLANLEGANKVRIKRVGQANLYFWV